MGNLFQRILEHPFGHRGDHFATQNITAVQAQHAPGHIRGVFNDEKHRLYHIVDHSGSAEQNVVDQGLFLFAGEQAPSSGAFCVPGFNKTEHDFIDAHLRGAHACPGFGPQ